MPNNNNNDDDDDDDNNNNNKYKCIQMSIPRYTERLRARLDLQGCIGSPSSQTTLHLKSGTCEYVAKPCKTKKKHVETC